MDPHTFSFKSVLEMDGSAILVSLWLIYGICDGPADTRVFLGTVPTPARGPCCGLQVHGCFSFPSQVPSPIPVPEDWIPDPSQGKEQ